MMHKIIARFILYMLMGVASVWAGEDQTLAKTNASASPDDEKVIAVMEILQLMDLAEELNIVKDMEILIEDDQDVRTTN